MQNINNMILNLIYQIQIQHEIIIMNTNIDIKFNMNMCLYKLIDINVLYSINYKYMYL